MKLSCLPVSFFSAIIQGAMSIADWARIGREAGLDAVDLSVLLLTSLDFSYLKRIREDIQSVGMKLAMVTSYPDFTHPDASERRKQIEREKDYIRAVAELGGAMIRITAGQAHPGLTEADGIRRALDGFKACEEKALQEGVQLALENHGKPGCWEYTDFDQPTPIFLSLAEGIRGSTIRINFDTANPVVYGDDPLEVLKHIADQVISVHAADTCTSGELNHVLLGTGLVRFPDIFAYLKKSSFDGWICMEENSKLGARGVIEAAAFVRRSWAEA